MVQATLNREDAEEPLIGDKEEEEGDAVSFGDIAREFSIMGWIGFGGERKEETGGSQPIISLLPFHLTLSLAIAHRSQGQRLTSGSSNG